MNIHKTTQSQTLYSLCTITLLFTIINNTFKTIYAFLKFHCNCFSFFFPKNFKDNILSLIVKTTQLRFWTQCGPTTVNDVKIVPETSPWTLTNTLQHKQSGWNSASMFWSSSFKKKNVIPPILASKVTVTIPVELPTINYREMLCLLCLLLTLSSLFLLSFSHIHLCWVQQHFKNSRKKEKKIQIIGKSLVIWKQYESFWPAGLLQNSSHQKITLKKTNCKALIANITSNSSVFNRSIEES